MRPRHGVPTELERIAKAHQGIGSLQRRSLQRRMFFTPVAPADEPADYIGDGSLPYPTLSSPWVNIGTDTDGKVYDASWFSYELGGIMVFLAVTGGEASIGSTVATIDADYPVWVDKVTPLVAKVGGNKLGWFNLNPDYTITWEGYVGVDGADGADGADGSPGAAGATGPAGSTGPAGGYSIDYVFSTTTTDADPGNGNLRLSNSTQTSATVIRADLVDAHGATVTAMLDLLDDSTSVVKGLLRLSKTNDPTQWIEFAVTALASPSGYRNITVAEIAASGSSPIFSNGDGVTLAFTSTGDKGDTGATGAAGSTGSPGTSAKLFDQTLGADTTTIDSTGASLAGYDVLEIFIIVRTDEAAAQGSVDVTLNGDTGANYDRQTVRGSSTTTPQSAPANAANSWALDAHGSGGSASYPVVIRITIPGYASTTFFKVAEATGAELDATAANQRASVNALGWRNTAAVSAVTVSKAGGAKMKAGSRMIIYGR